MAHAFPQDSPACWAINHFRLVEGNPVWWPAIRTNPEDVQGQAPPFIPDRVLVKYAGPPATKGKAYDMYWITPGEVWNFRQAKEFVLSKQLSELERVGHLADFQKAMDEAAKFDRTYDDVVAERVQLEQDLLQVSSAIPTGPRTAFQVFAQDRLDEMDQIPQDTPPEVLQSKFIAEFSSMTAQQQQEFETRGQEEFARLMTQAVNTMREAGPNYLKVCEELNVSPDAQLVPAIQLAVFSTIVGNGGKKRPRESDSAPYRHEGAAAHGGTFKAVAAGADGAPVSVSVNLPPADLAVEVICNDTSGILYPATCRVMLDDGREMTATQFEQYAGCASAKKWKMSLKIKPGQVPECPEGAPPMQVGKWLDLNGWIAGGSRTVRLVREPRPMKAPRITEPRAMYVPEHDSPHPPVPRAPPAPAVPQDKKDADEAAAALDRMRRRDFEPIAVRWAGDRCAVCDSEIDYDYDQLVSCHGCGVAVHQSCYGVRELPGAEEVWFCRACEQFEKTGVRPHCAVCPVEGGALKPTTISGVWCHVACMQWIPELGASDTVTMEPIQGLERIPAERWGLNCCVCRQRVGAKIQCTVCCTSFHPLCGRLKGLTMEMLENPKGPDLPLVQIVQCAKHCTPKAHATGVTYKHEQEGAEHADGLVNGFPYEMPPSVELQQPTAGASRLQPLAGIQQERDGTGIGNSSKAAWWIPTEADAKRQAADEHATAAKGRVVRRRFGRGGGVPGFRRKPATKRPPPEVPLKPLPNGLPEVVQVTCNGKIGNMRLRNQRIEYNGEEFAASKFEAVCGKADAKKWKSTLLYYDPATQQGRMSMGDWLAKMEIDRHMLAKLKDNWDAYCRWQDWLANEDGVGHGGHDDDDDAASPGDGGAENEDDNAMDDDTSAPPDPKPSAASVVSTADNASESAQNNDAEGPSTAAATSNKPSNTGEEVTQGAAKEQGAQSDGTAAGALARTKSGKEDGDADKAEEEEENSKRPAIYASRDVPGVWKVPLHALQPLEEARPVSVFSYEVATPAYIELVKRRTIGARDPANPASWVGRCVRVHWPADVEWYTADVIAYVPEARRHRLLYHDDDETEELDLAAEEAAGRLRWLEGAEAEAWQKHPLLPHSQPKAPAPTFHTPKAEPETSAGGRSDAPAAPPAGGTLDGPSAAVQAAQAAASAAAANAGAGNPAAASRDTSWMPNGLTETGVPVPHAERALGWRVDVLWNDDQMWYSGIVESYDESNGKHQITFDDGGREWLRIAAYRVQWVAPDAHAASRAARDAYLNALNKHTAAAVEHAQREADARAATAPSVVQVVCNSVPAEYETSGMMIRAESGARMTPTEFERFAGRGTAKKWKMSIRVADANGSGAETLGDWLIANGLDVNRAAIQAAMQPGRRRVARRSAPSVYNTTHLSSHAAAGFARPTSSSSEKSQLHGKKRHRPDCSCIICKQARRRGGPSDSAPSPVPMMQPASRSEPPLRSGTSKAILEAGPGRPAFRTGKHAYLLSLPYIPGGCKPPGAHPMRSPPSRAWHPDEWTLSLKLHRQLTESALAHSGSTWPVGSDGRSSAAGEISASAPRRPHTESALQRLLQPPGHGSSLPVVVSKGTLARMGAIPTEMSGGDSGRVSGSEGTPNGRAGAPAPNFGARLAVLSMRDKVQTTVAFERERLTFNKSGVHGWGLTAREDIPQDSMVIEYRGDVLRPVLQDIKEKAYQRDGVDVYLFALTENVLIDATVAGTIGRFTNAACQPCLYSKVLEVDGQPTLMFFARTDLRAGQELTYDYRFRAQEGCELTPCLCGAPNCRGTLELVGLPPAN